jgi:hypothetical protein
MGKSKKFESKRNSQVKNNDDINQPSKSLKHDKKKVKYKNYLDLIDQDGE